MAKIQYRYQFKKGKGRNPFGGCASVIVLGLIFYVIWVLVFMGMLWF